MNRFYLFLAYCSIRCSPLNNGIGIVKRASMVQSFSTHFGITSAWVQSFYHKLKPRLSKHGFTAATYVASENAIQAPWNAPRFVWSLVWSLQKLILPLLYMFERSNIPRDNCFNLSVLWWKAISGNNVFSPSFDGGVAFDFLPPITRWIVSFPFCLLYPRLHHQNVAMRTAYLDQLIQKELQLQNSSCTPVCIVTLGAGFDTRSVRFGQMCSDTTSWYDLDLPLVVQQKQFMLSRFFARRKLQNRGLNMYRMPELVAVDLNDVNNTKQQLSNVVSQFCAKYPNKSKSLVFIVEATLFYLDQSLVPSLLSTCLDTVKPHYSNISLCFADRFPLANSTRIRITDSTIQRTAKSNRLRAQRESTKVSLTDRAIPSAAAEINMQAEESEARELLQGLGFLLTEWRIKPGIARHMGRATGLRSAESDDS